MDKSVTDVISKETMEQYEKVRQSDVCNMFNVSCVVQAARTVEFTELKKIAESFDTYTLLLMNFQELMRYYDIKQDK